MGDKVSNQNSEARDDDQKIEENYDFDQHGHAGNKDLRAEKDAIFKDEQTENFAQRLMSRSKHEESDQLHREHDRESQYGHGTGEPEGLTNSIGNGQRKYHAHRTDDEQELGCRTSWISRATLSRPMIRHTK